MCLQINNATNTIHTFQNLTKIKITSQKWLKRQSATYIIAMFRSTGNSGVPDFLRQIEIWDTAVACGSEHSNNVRNNHPEEDKNY